jgi:hypothetical protein
MRVCLRAGFLALLSVSAQANAATHYLTVINDSAGTVTNIAYAPTGTDRWFAMQGGPLLGGSAGQTAIAMPPSSCVFDIRVRFADGNPLTIKAWNACRQSVLHVGRPLEQGALATHGSGP